MHGFGACCRVIVHKKKKKAPTRRNRTPARQSHGPLHPSKLNLVSCTDQNQNHSKWTYPIQIRGIFKRLHLVQNERHCAAFACGEESVWEAAWTAVEMIHLSKLLERHSDVATWYPYGQTKPRRQIRFLLTNKRAVRFKSC